MIPVFLLEKVVYLLNLFFMNSILTLTRPLVFLPGRGILTIPLLYPEISSSQDSSSSSSPPLLSALNLLASVKVKFIFHLSTVTFKWPIHCDGLHYLLYLEMEESWCFSADCRELTVTYWLLWVIEHWPKTTFHITKRFYLLLTFYFSSYHLPPLTEDNCWQLLNKKW